MKRRFILLIILFYAGIQYCKAQQLEKDPETTQALLRFQLFADSVEQLIKVHQLSFDTIFAEISLTEDKVDTIVFEPSSNRKFFNDHFKGGYIYHNAIEAQYYFVELPNIACLVTRMTLDQRKEYVETIARFEGFLRN